MSALAALAAALAWLCRGRRPSLAGARLRALSNRERPVHTATAQVPPPWRLKAVQVRRRREVVQLASDLAAELRAGGSWEQALGRAPSAGELGDALRTAADPDRTLVRLGRLPGAEGLRSLHAVGRLTAELGCPAAALADEVADALRADELSRRAVDVELAGAVATARLLAVLPALGLLMGSVLGSQPVHVLAGTGAGRGCALAALVLEAVGIAWCRRIRTSAERG